MAISNNSTKAFTDAIRRMALAECKQIDSQTKLLRSQKLTEMKKDVRRKYDVYIDRELSKQKSDINRRISEASEQSRRELASLRSELTDSVFENVLKRIEEFTQTPEYVDMLVESIRSVSAELKGGKIRFFLCERDMQLKDVVLKKLGEDVDISCDSSILVGGVRALCESTGTLADDTLDVRLEEQKKWFLENSGLKI